MTSPAPDQGDADAHAAAVDRLIAAILDCACHDAMSERMKPCDQQHARCAIMWLAENGRDYIEHLGWTEKDLLAHLSGARQPALRFGGL